MAELAALHQITLKELTEQIRQIRYANPRKALLSYGVHPVY